jgi:hypothetical protein
VTHDLEPVAIRTIRNGVQETWTLSGEELRREIERASRGSVQWTQDEIEVRYETDSPWPRWRAADPTRSFRSPYRDDNAWPDSVTPTPLGAVLEPWDWVGWAGNVLDALLGAKVELGPEEEHAVVMLERLAEVLADEPDGSVRAVARVLARIIVDKGVSVKTEPGQTPQEALFEALCWYLGVDGTCGWQEQLPSVEAPRPRAEQWVKKCWARRIGRCCSWRISWLWCLIELWRAGW